MTPRKRLRIAIVNDSILAQTVLARLVRHGGHEVLWLAPDGPTAVAQARAQPPDLILMDLVMPRIDGAATTREIMRAAPCLILVVTSSLQANLDLVYQAMSHGAQGAIETPASADADSPSTRAFLDKLDSVGRLVRGAAPAVTPHPVAREGGQRSASPLVVIGASTGGPAALCTVLAAMGEAVPAPIVIIQHVAAAFAPGLAIWLAQHARFPVEVAVEGARPQVGRAVLASTDDHLVLDELGALHYTPQPIDNPYRPSVDGFLASAVAHWPGRGVAALLTGMGKDGAAAMLEATRAGWWTVAQDEATSVVYGMPRAAKELGGASVVLPIGDIGGAIARRVGELARGR
jgi:chemotaxis response regulator CheB